MVPAPAVTIVVLTRARGGPVTRSMEDVVAQRDVEAEVLGLDAHPADALDAALRVATAEWIAFIEAGDRWHPRHLRTSVDLLEVSGAAWTYGAAVLLGADGAVIGARAAAPARDLTRLLRRANVVGGASSVVCRRDLLAERRPFDRRLRALVHWAAWSDLALAPAVACTETLVAERWEEDRAVLDARVTRAEVALLRAEGRIDAAPAVARRLEELGHGRDAARLHARAAVAARDPRGLARAVRALRSRGSVRPRGAAPEWLRA